MTRKYAVALVWAEAGDPIPTVEFVEANSPKEAAEAAISVYEPTSDWDVDKWDAKPIPPEQPDPMSFKIEEVGVYLTVKEIE
jgi:hypothetical protein